MNIEVLYMQDAIRTYVQGIRAVMVRLTAVIYILIYTVRKLKTEEEWKKKIILCEINFLMDK